MKALATLTMVLTAVTFSFADKEPPVKLEGAYVRTLKECSVRFDFKKDTVEVVVKPSPDAEMKIVAKYTLGKDNVLSGEITKVTKKGEVLGPMEGDKFGFTVEQKKDGFVLKDLTIDGADDAIKAVYQGEYVRDRKKSD